MLASEVRSQGPFTPPPLMAVGLDCSADQSGQSGGLYQAAEPHSSGLFWSWVSHSKHWTPQHTAQRLTEEQAGVEGLFPLAQMDVSKPSHLALSLLRGQHSVCEEFTSKVSTLEEKFPQGYHSTTSRFN